MTVSCVCMYIYIYVKYSNFLTNLLMKVKNSMWKKLQFEAKQFNQCLLHRSETFCVVLDTISNNCPKIRCENNFKFNVATLIMKCK